MQKKKRKMKKKDFDFLRGRESARRAADSRSIGSRSIVKRDGKKKSTEIEYDQFDGHRRQKNVKEIGDNIDIEIKEWNSIAKCCVPFQK